MSSSSEDNKITGIDHLNVITNGTVDEIKRTVTNPNQIGSVVNIKTGESISQITPVIMIINQGRSDLNERIAALVENGADLNMEINYYGRPIKASHIREMRLKSI